MQGATLSKYYRDGLFPLELIYRMMTMDKPNESAEARIIAVQFQSDSGVWVMADYRRDSCEALKKKILFSSSKLPESLHMACFKSGNKLIRAQKELVFDLDITDFVRFCPCQGFKRLCPICWPIIQGASVILQHLLENSLGYERRHLLWVFSGCKGIHCLINKSLAMSLNEDQRKKLYKRLSIPIGDDGHLVNFIRSVTQTNPEILTQLEELFTERLLREHDLFTLSSNGESDSFDVFCLKYLRLRHISLYYLVKSAWDEISLSPSPSKKLRLETTGVSSNISLRKWRILQTLENNTNACKPSVFIMVRLLYPMIDEGPLKLNHQCKLPFSVHSQTHNVSLPLKQSDIMQMNIQTDTLHINDLCRCSKTVPPPPVYTAGIRELERWIEAYANEETEFIVIDD